MRHKQPPPAVLSIAGSDNSAGAGAQADLKTFTALGAYGLTAITCVVAEVPGKVSAIHPVPPHIVAEQIRLSLEAFPVSAVKTGMLYSAEIMATVCDLLEGTKIPIVVDPVMVATSGASLLKPEAVEIYRRRLFPRAAVVTPNMDEAAALTGASVKTVDEMRAAGTALAGEYGGAWLMKGGHMGGEECIDLLMYADGRVEEFRSPRVHGVSTHGTGCTFSAAIAVGLGQGFKLAAAVQRAKQFVTAAIRDAHQWGEIHALDHGAR